MKMNKAIDKVADLLSVTSMPFVLCVIDKSDKKETLQMRYWGSYKDKMACFSGIANMIMDDYVEENGYIVHCDLRDVLERTIAGNEKQPNKELQEKVLKQLKELCKDVKFDMPEPELTQSIKENDVDNMIHALRCCEEVNCAECPRFMDEDEDGENKYTTLCNQALMREAALMLEEFANGTRGRE